MKGEPKQVIVIRKDLKMRKGKIAAQAAHASLKACFSFARFVESQQTDERGKHNRKKELILDITDPTMNEWWSNRFKKVVVYVNSEEELLKIYEEARLNHLPCSLIRDAGDTEFHGVPTFTAVAIGPHKEEHIDPITGELPLL